MRLMVQLTVITPKPILVPYFFCLWDKFCPGDGVVMNNEILGKS